MKSLKVLIYISLIIYNSADAKLIHEIYVIYAPPPNVNYFFSDSLIINPGDSIIIQAMEDDPWNVFYPAVFWLNNGDTINEIPQNIITIHDTGTISYGTTNLSLVVRFAGITSTSEIKNETLTSIFPNPVLTNLNIEFQNPILHLSYKIYNFWGQEIISEKAENSYNQSLQINSDFLKPGIYFIDLIGDNLSERRKFVKE